MPSLFYHCSLQVVGSLHFRSLLRQLSIDHHVLSIDNMKPDAACTFVHVSVILPGPSLFTQRMRKQQFALGAGRFQEERVEPENLSDQLDKIGVAAGSTPIWIDAETHLRSDVDPANGRRYDHFDLGKVYRFLSIAAPFVVNS